MKLKTKITRQPLMTLQLKQKLRTGPKKGLLAAAIYYERKMKDKLKSGKPLKVQTGRLSQAPTHNPPVKGALGWFIVVGTNLIYAVVHELGLWAGRGRGFKMPERPTWRPVFAKYRKQMVFAVRRYIRPNYHGVK